jgi:phosphodiesterase/alkaline phosphatase D-like protein
MPFFRLRRVISLLVILSLGAACTPAAALSQLPLQAFLPAQARAFPGAPKAAAAPGTTGFNLILGRPTANTITASLYSLAEMQVALSYGTQSGSYTEQAGPLTLQAGVPQNLEISGLEPDTTYYYIVLSDGAPSAEHSFHTQRPPGSTFTFTIDADPHNRDPRFNGELYTLALANTLNDHPDFHINLGDTFMSEKVLTPTYTETQNTLAEMRPYFGVLGADAPLFLVNGNHEGELGWLLSSKTLKDLPLWATHLRQLYYPNPTPGGFYSGSSSLDPVLGRVRDGYYAWTWGDALFIVLDPYWYTTKKPQPGDLNNNWNWTLGKEQYDWLKSTLESSSAHAKFIFIHNLVGGSAEARGGIEFARYFEWGGDNADGSYGFETQRPGWGKPIHQLLVENQVSAIFHGHDHVYVRQELNGIVYQEVPQPSNTEYNKTSLAAEYGYVNGDVLGSSGHLRVTVSPDQVSVAYVRAYLPQDEKPGQQNGEVDHPYDLFAAQKGIFLPLIQGKSASVSAGFAAAEILGRPTDTGITINELPAQEMELYYEYGVTSSLYTAQTPTQTVPGGQPVETALSDLQPGTRYYFRPVYRSPGGALSAGEERTFVTRRLPGSEFTFDIQGDSHPERVNNQFNAALYTRTLLSAAADQPDFYFTIGDDFSVDALQTVNASIVRALYVAQRNWLGLVGAPLFLVNGNHEQAALANLDSTADNVAVWAQTARNANYPQPAPDTFYTGDAEPVQFIGLLRDYYAFTWGDALFVVIDPYWHSPVVVDNPFGDSHDGSAKRDLWEITLGEAQYQWLKQTLENSPAKYKFVFAHHVNGTGRGGIELAGLYEWGGKDRNGSDLFAQKRPGWEKPIHQLMADNHVTIFFQGHDHIFARQDLDGVVYQTLPEPANPYYTYENTAAYLSGDKYPNSGHLRVSVSPQGVTVTYVRSFLEKADEIAFSYTIK